MFLDSKVRENLENAADIANNDVKKAIIAQNFFGLDSCDFIEIRPSEQGRGIRARVLANVAT